MFGSEFAQLAPEHCDSGDVFPTGTLSWADFAFDKPSFCQCIGAVNEISDYELPNCSIHDLGLDGWIEACNSKETCLENAFMVTHFVNFIRTWNFI